MTARRSLITDQFAASCYFRTSVPTGQRKALIQITERCNLHCAHCFVSAGDYGDTMRLADITGLLIPRLGQCRVPRLRVQIAVDISGSMRAFARPLAQVA